MEAPIPNWELTDLQRHYFHIDVVAKDVAEAMECERRGDGKERCLTERGMWSLGVLERVGVRGERWVFLILEGGFGCYCCCCRCRRCCKSHSRTFRALIFFKLREGERSKRKRDVEFGRFGEGGGEGREMVFLILEGGFGCYCFCCHCRLCCKNHWQTCRALDLLQTERGRRGRGEERGRERERV